MSAPRYEIRKADTHGDAAPMWYFVFKGGNGETMLTSELYTTKADAHRAINDVDSAMKAVDWDVSE